MDRLCGIFDRVRALPDPSVDQALAAALPTAEGPCLERIADTILTRRNRASQAALLGHFHRLPAELRWRVVGQVQALADMLRQAAWGPDPVAQTNVARIIGLSRASPLADVLPGLLEAREPVVRKTAADALLALAQHSAGAGDDAGADPAQDPPAAGPPTASQAGQPPPNPAFDHAGVQRALQQALGRYDVHREPGVLLAMLTLGPRLDPGTLALLDRPRHPALADLRRLLARTDHPALQRCLPLLLGVAPLAEDAQRRLAGLLRRGEVRHLLAGAHTALLGPVARGLGRIEGLEDWGLPPRELAMLAPAEARQWPRFLAHLPLAPRVLAAELGKLAEHSDPLARLNALRALSQLADDSPQAACGTLAAFCDDDDPLIARIALRQLLRLRWADLPRLLPRLVNSPHDQVRRLARRQLAPMGFERLWEAWPRLTEVQRLTAGRALIKIDDHFHHKLSEHLAGGDRDGCVRALSIIHGLNQGPLFESALLILVQDSDPRVAASAVRALGSIGTPAASAAAAKALDHPDSRVRANAVEVVALLPGPEYHERLRRMARDEQGRPRANAIAALLPHLPEEALAALADMLADDRPGQRASALWLVESAGLLEAARCVAELALNDPDPAVKARAEHTAGRLMELMRQSHAA